ncbi:MAG: ribosome-associated translation inhibitor RaiA [Verrucomicrobiales bacterium]|nr:ribosome-associated translation inhibitor RaiA [Verrucomicrobiales bacterium]
MPETEKDQAPDFPISITARHMELTGAIREYAEKKVGRIHYGYPRIIEAKVILDSTSHGHVAEIVIVAADNVTIEADTESADLYEAIDLTVQKVERQMRKEKTRMLQQHGHG